MDAGASVVAFIVVALQSTKTVHNFLSAVKDGPKNVQKLADWIAQLQSILERLSQIRIEQINSTDANDLSIIADRCATDITVFESKLQRLNVTDTDKCIGKLWKRLRAVISEKDIDRTREVFREHALMLNVRLSLLQTTQMSMSSTQSCEILELLKQLRREVSRPCAASNAANHVTAILGSPNTAKDGDETEAKRTMEKALQESISRLITLVNKKECTVESESAGEMIEDIQTLLEFAQKRESGCTVSEMPTASCATRGVRGGDDVSNELKLANSLIFSAPSIAINSTERLELAPSYAPGVTIDQQRKRKIIDISSGTLSVSTNKRFRKYTREPGRGDSDEHGSSRSAFIASILYKPKTSQSMLTISISQMQSLHGSVLSIPRLSVNNIRPKGSYVFELAKSGRVEDLTRLVAEGKASLRDHDTNGWSLLHYAICNPPMCRFLVQNGLDMDEIAQADFGGSEMYVHTTSSTIYLVGTAGRENLIIYGTSTPLHNLLLSILRGLPSEAATILLDAGADPTLEIRGWENVVSFVSPGANFHFDFILRQIFLRSAHFGVATAKDTRGCSPILRACNPLCESESFFTSERNIQKLELLLKSGCNIRDTDNDGLTCLHNFFNTLVPAPSAQTWKASLMYLLQQGADPHALDNLGRSVSHIAYSKTCWDIEMSLGTYRGDLFDSVLDSCGYSILEFRKNFHSRRRYGDNYTRKDFELLWQGHEDRCPYWDDAEWCDSSKGSIINGLGNYQAFLCNCDKNCSGDDDGNENNDSEEDKNSIGDDQASDEEGVDQDGGDDDSGEDGKHRTTQDIREQMYPQAHFSAWELTSQVEMEWNSSTTDMSGPRSYTHHNFEGPEYDELFHLPWEIDRQLSGRELARFSH